MHMHGTILLCGHILACVCIDVNVVSKNIRINSYKAKCQRLSCTPKMISRKTNLFVLFHVNFDRFFCMMGTLFSFIAKDITEKSRILREHKSENPDQFTVVQTMVDYEVSNDLTKSKTASGLLSGSRTLLRLHRSLLFFAKFLEKVPALDDEAKCSEAASEIYGITLGNFHPWLIRQAAYLAMRSLPTKKVLIERYIKQNYQEAEELVPLLVKAMLDVYDIIESLYADKDLLQLP